MNTKAAFTTGKAATGNTVRWSLRLFNARATESFFVLFDCHAVFIAAVVLCIFLRQGSGANIYWLKMHFMKAKRCLKVGSDGRFDFAEPLWHKQILAYVQPSKCPNRQQVENYSLEKRNKTCGRWMENHVCPVVLDPFIFPALSLCGERQSEIKGILEKFDSVLCAWLRVVSHGRLPADPDRVFAT